MVQCMESWFIADAGALNGEFGFKLPMPGASVEDISKGDALMRLEKASAHLSSAKRYKKGEPSFRILERIDPQKVCDKSPWARRLVEALQGQLRGL